jgi:AbrB family looped-hinge helix DNA binding protein
MTALVQIHRKGQMTLPKGLRSALGVGEGDFVEASVQRGKIILTPKLVIDRSRFPKADDEYTPAQRRLIDRGIAKSTRQYQRGSGIGPFQSAQELVASLHKRTGRSASRKRTAV